MDLCRFISGLGGLQKCSAISSILELQQPPILVCNFLHFYYATIMSANDMELMKKIEIDGQEVAFRVSAAVPRIYRIKFHRDIYKDLRELDKAVSQNNEDESGLDVFSLEMFENIAYIMAK